MMKVCDNQNNSNLLKCKLGTQAGFILSKLKNKIKLVVIVCLMILLTSCGIINAQDNNKKKIVTTQYPQYQFVKAIIGNDKRLNDYFDVSLIVPPGADSHSFDPRLTDLISIKNADLFIYTSDSMETWVKGLELKRYTNVLDLSSDKRIELINVTEHEHDEESHHHVGEHEHEYDPHYWIYPIYACYMVDTIRNKMLEISSNLASECKDVINQNADNYIEELKLVDKQIRFVVEHAKTKTLYFASPFSFFYWAYFYDLEYVLTYSTCSIEIEPSLNTLVNVINKIKENDVKVIYTKELMNNSVAKMIREKTGVEIRLLHSCHSVSKDDFKTTTFLDLMKQNIYNLAVGLDVNPSAIPDFNESGVKPNAIS